GAGACGLGLFVGVADAGGGADEDLERAGLMLFAPRGLEQGLRRGSLVRVAPLIRHHESNSSSPGPSILSQMPRSVTAMLEGPAPPIAGSRARGECMASGRGVPISSLLEIGRSVTAFGFRRLANDTLAPLRRCFVPIAPQPHRGPSCAPAHSPAGRPGSRGYAPRHAARPAAARDLRADCALSQLGAPGKRLLPEKCADRVRRPRSLLDRWGRQPKDSPV